ncbi:MAG: glycoside hydrolase family 3 C-terminal domain-containing protein [Anaerolineales bacterium]|nr:glycoside hydrolase family 3 C-terminal domain-containing protein [Anaerolineales bacterium]
MTTSLQRIARDLDLPLFVIATDQEGGQLTAIGTETTPLPGNMALGATGSTTLAHQAGEVLGRELAAMGVNVNYAPVCDVNINPQNPVIGIRSFGENPEDVALLADAMIKGMQAQGVAATAKHFPGHGDTDGDSHHELTSVSHPLERLRDVEFVPFKAAIKSGAKLIMTAHLAIPAIDGDDAPPATLSPAILQGLLRDELGYDGVIITDAMNMQAIKQGDALGGETVRAVNAGADLLLFAATSTDQENAYAALLDAAEKGQLNTDKVKASQERIDSLKSTFFKEDDQPDLSVVGCAAHLALATEIAERAITLVRDDANLLPLKLQENQRVAVVLPKPVDLTPADTSSYITLKLADSLRESHANLDEISISHDPAEKDALALVEKLREYDLIMLGTLNASATPKQAEFVRAVLKTEIPTVVVALRLPYDLMAFPEAPTYLCTYDIQEPSMGALAKVLFGKIPARGQLPVSIPGLYSAGYSLNK